MHACEDALYCVMNTNGYDSSKTSILLWSGAVDVYNFFMHKSIYY